MKKILMLLFFIFLSSTLAYATNNINVNEIKLESTQLPTAIKLNPQNNYDNELKKMQQEETVKQDIYNQGEDYIYRMRQQMMAPVNINPMNNIMPLGNFCY